MNIHIYWAWFKIFRPHWYTGNRLKYRPELKDSHFALYDLGPLTISIRRNK